MSDTNTNFNIYALALSLFIHMILFSLFQILVNKDNKIKIVNSQNARLNFIVRINNKESLFNYPIVKKKYIDTIKKQDIRNKKEITINQKQKAVSTAIGIRNGNFKITYPYLSRINQEEGIVKVKVWVKDNKLQKTILLKPSKYKRLNEEVLKVIKKTKFKAILLSTKEFVFNFSLDNERE